MKSRVTLGHGGMVGHGVFGCFFLARLGKMGKMGVGSGSGSGVGGGIVGGTSTVFMPPPLVVHSGVGLACSCFASCTGTLVVAGRGRFGPQSRLILDPPGDVSHFGTGGSFARRRSTAGPCAARTTIAATATAAATPVQRGTSVRVRCRSFRGGVVGGVFFQGYVGAQHLFKTRGFDLLWESGRGATTLVSWLFLPAMFGRCTAVAARESLFGGDRTGRPTGGVGHFTHSVPCGGPFDHAQVYRVGVELFRSQHTVLTAAVI